MSLLEAFRDGGLPMVLLLGAWLLAMPLTLARLGLSGRTRAPGLGAALALGLVLMGLLGTFYGLYEVFLALGAAAQEVRQALFAEGVRMARVPTRAGLIAAATLAPLHGLAALREGGGAPRWARGLALGTGLMASACVGGVLVAQRLILGTLDTSLSSPDAPAAMALEWASRVGTGVTVGLALGALGLLSCGLGAVSALIAAGAGLRAR